MVQVSDTALKNFLDTIKDPKQRKMLSDIAYSKVVSEIHCLSEKCNGRLIGYVYETGMIQPVKDSNDKLWLRSSRDRLDGNKGFECWCGNDSRIATQERLHIKDDGNPPTREGLNEIYKRVTSNPSNYPVVNDEQIIDGFSIRSIK